MTKVVEVKTDSQSKKQAWTTGRLYSQLALHYRLSLDTMHLLLKNLKEPQMTREEVEIFLSYYTPYESAIIYLFRYETVLEPEEKTIKKRGEAIRFLNDFKSSENRSQLLQQLIQIDLDFQQIQNKEEFLSDDDFKIIEKYRLKYSIAFKQLAKILKRDRRWIMRREKKLMDEILKRRCQELNEYYKSRFYTRGKKS